MASSSLSLSSSSLQPPTAAVVVSTGRSLRETLSIIENCLPKKKRRLEKAYDAQNTSANSHENNEKTKEQEVQVQAERLEDERECLKRCLNEMIPFVYSKKRKFTPYVSNAESTEYMSNQKSQQKEKINSDFFETEKKEKDEEVQEEAVDRKENSSVSNSSSYRSSVEYEVYAEKLKKLKKENSDIQIRKERIIKHYANLVYSYEYGLKAVSKLNDLTSAPDNVMKGNDQIETIFE